MFSRVLQRDILPITQYLLQDTQPEVRSSVCRQLPSLLCKVDQLSENLLLTSLLDAAQDNSAQVRCAVLDVLIDSEPYIFKGYIKALILPTLKKLVESSLLPSQDEFLLHVSKLYSRLCNTYKEYMDLEDKAWFVSQFATLCQVDSEPIDTFLSSSLVPMMLFVESVPDLCKVLVSCVLALSTSPYTSVRQILCSTLFEVIKTCDGKSRKLLLEVLVILLQEKLEVFHSLIPNLFSMISIILQTNETEDCPVLCEKLIASLKTCEDTVSKCYKWRLHVLLMQEFQRLVGLLSASVLLDHFQEVLFYRIKKSRPIPSRLAASKTLLVLLIKINNDNLTSKCISRIHQDLYCSRSFYDRNLFVKICHQTIQMLSFEEFKKYFLPSLILLSADPVANIRYSVSSLLVHSSVRLMSCPEPGLTSRIDQCLGELKTDPDVDVSANVNSLVSKLKEKRASALLNLLIEPALVVQEDLVDQIPPNDTMSPTSSAQQSPNRAVMIHPYMKASIEKEFLIDAGIPLNSTPMSENYNQNVNRDSSSSLGGSTTEGGVGDGKINVTSNMNKSFSNINVSLNKSQDVSATQNKESSASNNVTHDNGHSFVNNTFDNNGNFAPQLINHKGNSKFGIPKKVVHHENLSNQIDNDISTNEKQAHMSRWGTSNDSDNNVIENSAPPLPIRKNALGTRYNGPKPSDSPLPLSKLTDNLQANDVSDLEKIPKNINELYVHNSNQSNNQYETSSSTLEYQMFKPKNNVKENEPNRSIVNNSSPGSKLKLAFMSTLSHNESVAKQYTESSRKDAPNGSQTVRRFLGNSSKETVCPKIEPAFSSKTTGVKKREEISSKPTQTTSPDLQIVSKPKDEPSTEGKTLRKQQSLIQPNFHRSLVSPKDQKRKSVHIMESYYSSQKKLAEIPIRPIDEKASNDFVDSKVKPAQLEYKEHPVLPNIMNPEVEKPSFVPSFQNKRKSMYQPSDRESLLTTFFKGQTLKYQPKEVNERKISASCLKKENSLISNSNIRSESSLGTDKSLASQSPINNTLPRPQKLTYRNQSPGLILRKPKIPEPPTQKDDNRPLSEMNANIVHYSSPNHQANVSNHAVSSVKDSSNSNSATVVTFTDKNMKENKESNLEDNKLIPNLDRTMSTAPGKLVEINSDQNSVDSKYPSHVTRQSKINHIDLQNNEFIFYKNENCSDVEIGHVDSPRNSFINVSEQEEISKTQREDIGKEATYASKIDMSHCKDNDKNISSKNNASHLKCHEQTNMIPKELFPPIPSLNDEQPSSRESCGDGDITQKILNLTTEVESIDLYLNLESTNTSPLPQCISTISPLKVDVTAPENNYPQKGGKISIANENYILPPTSIIKRSPNLDKKKVMFLNDQVVTPEECQRLSLSFERELIELNSKIEEINEEIRIETLNLQQAKNKNSRNISNNNILSSKQYDSCNLINDPVNQNLTLLHESNAFLQDSKLNSVDEKYTPIDTSVYENNTDNNAGCIADKVPSKFVDMKVPSTPPLLDNINENQLLEVSKQQSENKPPPIKPRVPPKTQVMNQTIKNDTSPPTYPGEKLDTDNEDQVAKADQEKTTSDINVNRVFKESKLLKRHAYRRSYDERISKIDFPGFSKRNDISDENNFNKHSAHRRSFDDKNYPISGSNENLVTNLPPKVPLVATSGTSAISSGLKKVSNYQIFSDRRKNILENKSFTVRIGSRNAQQSNSKRRDISPSLSGSYNSSTSQVQQENIQLKTEPESASHNMPVLQRIIPEEKIEPRPTTNEYNTYEPNVNKVTTMLSKPRVPVSPLKYSSAATKKSISTGHGEMKTKPTDLESIPQVETRYSRNESSDQVVTLRSRSISPQTIVENNAQNQINSKLSNQSKNSEVSCRRPMSKMQTPRSISQIIESKIPGLSEDSTPPTREKSIAETSGDLHIQNTSSMSPMKSRFVCKSPSPSKMIQQPRYESTLETNQQTALVKKSIPTPPRVDNLTSVDVKTIRTNPNSENPVSEVKKFSQAPIVSVRKVSHDSITKVVKVCPSPSFGVQHGESTGQVVPDHNGGSKKTLVMVRRSPSSVSNESLTCYHKSQGNLSKNSSESLTNHSEAASDMSDNGTKIPGKKNFKGSKFSCLRSDQESFYKNCHISSDERPRSCIIPNGIHIPDKNNADLKAISEENLQHNNRRAASAGTIPCNGGGSKLPRRSIKF
ncbi:hypothetical protein M8J76_011090 [Diaphorina citri]|nr:hypothetical protein M8J76_011090 [Diaphorina citri]